MSNVLDLSKVTLIVSEIDGVLTDHISPITETGNVLYKYYHVKDFEAINRIKREFNFVFLSADNSINYNLCSVKKIPFFWAKDDKDNRKAKVIQNIMNRYSASADNTIFVGCSYTDEECIKMIPLSFCPSDSIDCVRYNALVVLKSPSATGVLCELYDKYLSIEISSRLRNA